MFYAPKNEGLCEGIVRKSNILIQFISFSHSRIWVQKIVEYFTIETNGEQNVQRNFICVLEICHL